MFVKYEKTYHVFPVTSKHNLDNTQLNRLLGGSVVVEEKMDGSNTGIIRHHKGFSLQKRNSLVGSSVHEQFDYIHNWANTIAYDRIMSVPAGHLIYGELLYARHHILYTSLPEYFLVFDVKFNGSWLNYADRKAFCEQYQFHMVPLVAEGSFTKNQLLDLIPPKSKYGDECEGVVVKRYAKHGYFRGKLVKSGFIKALDESDEHWSTRNVERNQLLVAN
jgi:ATP-dependent RNA circularization protein (DNA/RNA ligase family)